MIAKLLLAWLAISIPLGLCVGAFIRAGAGPAHPRRRRKPIRKGMAVHHLDGNPYNNDPANLRLIDIRENARRKP